MTTPVTRDSTRAPPVAIGGVGGSGTRLIAQILRWLGYYMGDDLNEAFDNLWFTLLFKRAELWAADRSQDDFEQAARVFRAVMCGDVALTSNQIAFVQRLVADRSQHTAAWLGQRAESLLLAAPRRPTTARWGWKEPNTHVFIDRLQASFPAMQYIHVMRNGLDMAYSENQNQLRLWGAHVFGDDRFEIGPRWSLKYWCHVHRRIARLGEQLMPTRYMLLNYDAFCAAPRAGVRSLLRFLGAAVDAGVEAPLTASVRRPDSIGRFKRHGLDQFDADDIACVASFGFDTKVDDFAGEKLQ